MMRLPLDVLHRRGYWLPRPLLLRHWRERERERECLSVDVFSLVNDGYYFEVALQNTVRYYALTHERKNHHSQSPNIIGYSDDYGIFCLRTHSLCHTRSIFSLKKKSVTGI